MIYLEYVIKRDGSQVTYNKDKIFDAIYAANAECEERNESYLSLSSIYDAIEDIDTRCHAHESDINVEQIQNIVERVLMSYEPDVARAYIRYRYMKEVAREFKGDFFEAIGEKLEAKNVVNQNANVDEHSFGGRMGETNGVIARKYALDYIVSPMAKNNHLNNQVYIHDLDAYAVGMHNCLTVPFDDLLANGFNTRQTDVRPAQSVNTAFQLVAVIFQLQSLQQFGGVSASHIDWTMVPYVRKSFAKHFRDGLVYIEGFPEENFPHYKSWAEKSIGDVEFWTDHGCDKKAYEYAMKMTEREVYQAVEGMYHNLNTLQSRSGNQLK